MKTSSPFNRRLTGAGVALLALLTGGCAVIDSVPLFDRLEPAPATKGDADYNYIVGPGDSLRIFVWRNPELSTDVLVRPDGKITGPLVEDLQAAGQTPTEIARNVEKKLGEYVRDPLVSVTVGGFAGEYSELIRVVGEAAKPQSLPYRKDMTVLDVMMATGGLTPFAAGNRASIVRRSEKGTEQYRVRLNDLIKDGNIEANVAMQPGDILIIPEAWF